MRLNRLRKEHKHQCFIRDEWFEDAPCDTPVCLWTELDSLAVWVIYEKCRRSSSLVWGPSQAQPFTVVKTWSLIQAVWIWEKHNTINAFPEKIPECIKHTHLFKCTWGWLCPDKALASDLPFKAWHQTSLSKTHILWSPSFKHRCDFKLYNTWQHHFHVHKPSRQIIVYNIMKGSSACQWL